MPKKPASEKQIESFVHDDASRRNIPPAEFQTMVRNQEKTPLQVAYERRNPDLDPQLIWRGKDLLDESPLVVNAPPLYIQEKIHPKVLIDDLKRRSKEGVSSQSGFVEQMGLFDTIKGDVGEAAKTEFYQHDQNWTNRMILGDSLQVMASLAEREGLRGKVQCIYFDPPYGIKFNSNFQWSTTSRGVKDGSMDQITREPEQVKAFRDTWRDGIHSYLGYLLDRLLAAKALLTDTGSIFVQIGDQNVHLIRSLMDSVFGAPNFISMITVKKTAGQDQALLDNVCDYILWFGKSKELIKYRERFTERFIGFDSLGPYSRVQMPDLHRRGITQDDRKKFRSPSEIGRIFRIDQTSSSGHGGNTVFPFTFRGRQYLPSTSRHWSTHHLGMERLNRANRLIGSLNTLSYVRFADDFSVTKTGNIWEDTGVGGFTDTKTYVVQTVSKIIERCIVMTTDPGDLVMDPTCGSGTTAFVAEQLGRRWITIDTSRVALALARARLMGARYPYYLLADSDEGKKKRG